MGVSRASLTRLIRPRSVAIVGASPDPKSISGGVLANLGRFGFGGQIHLVSRSQKEIAGRHCLAAISDLPRGIDAAVLVVPQAAVMEAVRACIERDVGGVVMFSSGFSEAGCEGKELQAAIALLAAESGLAVLGPNCMGYCDFTSATPLTFDPIEPQENGDSRCVAVVTQSGAMGVNIRSALQSRGIPVSQVISTGNEAVLTAEDFVEYLLDQPEVRLITIFAEQLRHPQKFLRLAKRASDGGVHLILLHTGSSESGRKSAQSHTGAMTGNHGAMRAAVSAEGVLVVETLDALFDVTAILWRYPEPKAGGLALVTNSGALRGLTFDGCDRLGLRVSPLAPALTSTLRDMLPAYVQVDNPLDIGTSGFADPSIYGRAAAVLADDPGIGFVAMSYIGGAPQQQLAKTDALLPMVADHAKPFLLNFIGDDSPLDPRAVADIKRSGLPFFRSLDRLLCAVNLVSTYAAGRAAGLKAADDPFRPRILVRPGSLAEHSGKLLLGQVGIPVPAGALCLTVNEALSLADQIGYPVVLKAQAAALIHKSDVGGVATSIRDRSGLVDAWKTVQSNLAAALPDLALDGMLIERMAGPGLEMIVAARRDSGWGVTLVIGIGGVQAEALGDFRVLSGDASVLAIDAEMRKLKAHALLGPHRGKPARDVAAAARVVRTLGDLLIDNPELAEIEVNPMVVHAEGEGVVALDVVLIAADH